MYITTEDAQAWAESTKLPFLDIQEDRLLPQIEAEFLSRIGFTVGTNVTDTWINPDETPRIIRTCIAKMYVSWYYDKQYSENISDVGSFYATRLKESIEQTISAINGGQIIFEGGASTTGGLAFFPTDDSSIMDYKMNNYDGPGAFTMGSYY